MCRGHADLRARYAFSCPIESGAICTLPEGSFTEELRNVESLRQYACKNGRSWYRYINGVEGRGRRAENGSLHLITGCEKTKYWGMAEYQGVTEPDRFCMSFGETGNEDRPYDWVDRGPGAAKSGSVSLEDIDGAPSPPRNQCMFIQGFTISLGQGVWASLFNEVKISSIENSPRKVPNAMDSFIPFCGPTRWLSLSPPSSPWPFSTWRGAISNRSAAEHHHVFSQSHADEPTGLLRVSPSLTSNSPISLKQRQELCHSSLNNSQ